MKRTFGRRHQYAARFRIFLIAAALAVGTVSCAPAQYCLTISPGVGGSVTTPGEGPFTYDAGTAVNLTATPDDGYFFVNWTGDVDTVANASAASTVITMNGGYNISANFDAVTTHPLPVLNSTYGTNTTVEDLTCWYQSASDPDGDHVKNIYNWYRNGSSIMVLNMPFEGGSSSTYRKDYSGYGNDGTVINAVWNSTAGHDGFGAYEFDGSRDYIDFGDNDNLDVGTSDFTVEAWVRTNATNPGCVLSKGCPHCTNGTGYSLELSDRAVFRISDDPSDSIICNIPPLPGLNLTNGEWHHIVGVYDRDGMLRGYYDGKYAGECSIAGSSGDVSNSDNFYIGTMCPGCAGSPCFNGTIDDVRIYNYALSLCQVEALYQNKTSKIVSHETAVGESWRCSVTPNDGTDDGTTLNSNPLTIADGTANVTIDASDYPSIQAAIDALPSSGGTVFIPAGDYSVNSTIKIPSNTALIGDGWDRTIVRIADNASFNAIENKHFILGDSNITIEDLMVDGNAANNAWHNATMVVGQNLNGFLFKKVERVTLERVFVKDCGSNGAHFCNGANENYILHSRFLNNGHLDPHGSCGVVFDNGSNHNEIIGTYSEGNGYHGLEFYSDNASRPSSNNTILNSVAIGNEREGLCLNGADSSVIMNSISRNNGGSGIRIGRMASSPERDLRNAAIGNTVENNMQHGISVNGYYVTVFNNTISGTCNSTRESDGIYASSGGSGNISNNAVYCVSRHGIFLNALNDTVVKCNSIAYTVNDALRVHDSYRVGVVENAITNSSHHGITASGSKGGQINIFGNSILNALGDGISIWEKTDVTISGNQIQKGRSGLEGWHEAGIRLYSSNRTTIVGNIIKGNVTQENGIYLQNSSSNILTNNIATNNQRDGLRIGSSSTDNTINSNTFCSSNQSGGNYYDIYDGGSNSGDENTCDTTYNWNDTDTTGCTCSC